MAAVAAIVSLVLTAWNSAPVHAQSLTMRVNIPFTFHVGAKSMPPGKYLVRKTGDALKIEDRLNSAMVMSTAVTNRAPNGGDRIIFNRYADQYFLSEVRWSGYSEARGLTKSKVELEVARTLGIPERVQTAGVGR
jgi:hypothetical protein